MKHNCERQEEVTQVLAQKRQPVKFEIELIQGLWTIAISNSPHDVSTPVPIINCPFCGEKL